MEIVTVLHVCEEGWHKFTSPELPGLYMIVPQDDLGAAYADLPRAIEELIYADTGKRVSAQPQKTFGDCLSAIARTQDPIPQHYSIEFKAA
jgi:hypothetical protein